jgi:hypothetical protein
MEQIIDWSKTKNSRPHAIVAIENLIRHELSCEVPNRVIIPHAGDGRTGCCIGWRRW